MQSSMRLSWLDWRATDRKVYPPAILAAMQAASSSDATKKSVPLPLDEAKRSAISAELERILESEAFHTSKRSQQFLSYVVRETLEGRGDQLKEQSIGIDVFRRSPEDMTEDGSLVRKQAGEVRRRIDLCKDTNKDAAVRIELPLGSYVPVFHFPAVEHSVGEANSSVDQVPVAIPSAPIEEHPIGQHRRSIRAIAVGALLVAVALCTGIVFSHRHRDSYPFFTRYWEPQFSSSQPIMVCMAKPIVYLPSYDYYQRYSAAHGGDFGLEWQRLNRRLPKDIDMAPSWTDMNVQEDYGIARGDALASFLMASFFGRSGKSSDLRIGPDCSMADLRSAPVVLIGAFNNRWTADMMSTLHFKFTEERDAIGVREQIPAGRVWKTEWNTGKRKSPWDTTTDLQPVVDYAIVSRLINTQTGQPMMIVAGISSPGTQAAAEFVSTPEKLNQALRNLGPGWENKNLQMVLRIPVPNGITPGASQVIASYSW